MSEGRRPKVAAIVTAWYLHSHADVIVGKLLEGFSLGDERYEPRVEVASLYLDQVPPDDMGHAMAVKHGVPIFETVGEAITLGGSGVNVDGVLIVGEHGDYPDNERGQKQYPRRRLFDAAVAAMVAGGRPVPIFVDKHLSWRTEDALQMYADAKRLGVPFLAGSTVPLAWRTPAVDWPYGAPMSQAIAVGYGSLEAYEFHALEGLQCMAERRAGGETGVASAEDVAPSELRRARASGRWDERLEWAALQAMGLTGFPLRRAMETLSHAILVEYRDGLKAAVLRYEGVTTFGFAGVRGDARAGEDDVVACQFALQPGRPYSHFGLLVRQIENMVLTGTPPYPVERTVLTSGVLDAAMKSRYFGGVPIPTPELGIAYTASDRIPDTATHLTPFWEAGAGA